MLSMQNNNETIYPCTFSKNYGIPDNQAWLLLKILYIYRFVLVSLFFILYISEMGTSVLGAFKPEAYQITTLIYFLLTLLAGVGIIFRFPAYTVQAQWFIFIDIIFITLLMHFSGGITSGIGILLVVSIAAGGLLIGGKCALVFAAIAATAIFTEQLYAHLTLHQQTAYTYSGILGASFFAIATLAYVLARRTEQSELLNLENQQLIVKLEFLNHYIIQHLQSGLMIVDSDNKINMANQAAIRLLHLDAQPNSIDQISDQLQAAYNQWQDTQESNTINLTLKDRSRIQIVFNPIEIQEQLLCLLMIEDSSLYNQRLQQGKLASLGRLTASIAHEIRNPLGAISHASQLLSEAPGLTQQDLRFTEIIVSNSSRVNKIIDDILQLSKRKNSQRQSLDLVTWLPAYREQFIQEQQIDGGQFQLQIDAERINILFDQGHLKQILDNLCLNALKYGGGPNFKLGTTYDLPNQKHNLDIIDFGPGISEADQQHLFEPFFTTSASGTGLGLYISSELAELNQSVLTYRKQVNGSCFTLSILDADNPIIEL